MKANVGNWRYEILISYRSEKRDAHGGISTVWIDGPTIRGSFDHIKSVEAVTDDKLIIIDTYAIVSWNVPELDTTAKLTIDGERVDGVSLYRDKVQNLMELTVIKHG